MEEGEEREERMEGGDMSRGLSGGRRRRSEVVTGVHSNVLHEGRAIWRGMVGSISSLFPIFSNFH